MGNERWSIDFHSQWGPRSLADFEFLAIAGERLKASKYFPGFITLRLSLLGFALSVTRYGA